MHILTMDARQEIARREGQKGGSRNSGRLIVIINKINKYIIFFFFTCPHKGRGMGIRTCDIRFKRRSSQPIYIFIYIYINKYINGIIKMAFFRGKYISHLCIICKPMLGIFITIC
jgi:hypothetical protein